MKTIWQELKEYRPSSICNCGGLKKTLEHFDSKYVMVFLMGLNDSYAGVRTQILLMDLIPPINNVVSLIIQEESQRYVRMMISSLLDSITLAATEVSKKSSTDGFQKKEYQRPLCTHCGLKGHTIDHCYKLHGYPPEYKPLKFCHIKSGCFSFIFSLSYKPNSYQVSAAVSPNQSAFFTSMSTSQYGQLIDLLNSHMLARSAH